MRHVAAALVLAIVLFGLPQTGKVWAQSVKGTGTVPVSLFPEQHLPQGNLTVAAITNPKTGLPNGVVRLRIPGMVEATAEVTFLGVSDNIGLAGGPIRAGNVIPGYPFLYILAIDNGSGLPADAIAILSVVDLSTLSPEAFAIFFADFVDAAGPIYNGNFTVTDGP
jgi:hypothetical protein